MRLRKKSSLRVVEHAAISDVGRQREGNEDAMLEEPPLFVVADGMGGAQAGEVASGLAVDTLGGLEPDDDAVEEDLTEAITEANRRIHDKAQNDRDLAGMGTTLTAAIVHDGQITIGHVGDSRAYRYRDGELAQLTDDHSLVAELERHGKLTAAEARVHPQRSMILRALGIGAEVEVDTYCFTGQADDVYLLCSDGLSGLVHDAVIAEVLESADTLEQAAQKLIELANLSGGPDNITALLFRLGT
jgi:serine/threonine protein phosphatase PrpC